jgi:hypothetical protein
MDFHEDVRIPDLGLGAFLQFQDFGAAVFDHCPHRRSASYPSRLGLKLWHRNRRA